MCLCDIKEFAELFPGTSPMPPTTSRTTTREFGPFYRPARARIWSILSPAAIFGALIFMLRVRRKYQKTDGQMQFPKARAPFAAHHHTPTPPQPPLCRWCGVVWCGCGVVWCGVGVVWCGMICGVGVVWGGYPTLTD